MRQLCEEVFRNLHFEHLLDFTDHDLTVVEIEKVRTVIYSLNAEDLFVAVDREIFWVSKHDHGSRFRKEVITDIVLKAPYTENHKVRAGNIWWMADL